MAKRTTTDLGSCIVDGCPKASATRRGLCKSHTQIYFRHGTTTPSISADIQRLMKFVRVSETTGCWEWQGATMGSNGRYGQFSMKASRGRGTYYAHRASYELLVGPIPDGLTIDHLCFNRLCVNPDHLEAVTQKVNNGRYAALRTECPKGHEFTPENTADYGNGRTCRRCHADSSRAQRARKQAS